jgi:hypothetical protein
VTDNILPHFESVPVSKADYLGALTIMKDGGWSGAYRACQKSERC